MATVPISSDQLETFTPSSLKNSSAPPSFILRPATGQDVIDFEYQIMAAGLIFHGNEEFRAEFLRGLGELHSDKEFVELKVSVENYWADLDQGVERSAEDHRLVRKMIDSVINSWRPFAVMAAHNARYNRELGRIAVGMYVRGWKGLETSYAREDGIVPIERVRQVERELHMMEAQALADKVDGVEIGASFAEIEGLCLGRAVLTDVERKNLQSPSSSTSAPNGSSPPPSKPTAGRKSKAPASSSSNKVN